MSLPASEMTANMAGHQNQGQGVGGSWRTSLWNGVKAVGKGLGSAAAYGAGMAARHYINSIPGGSAVAGHVLNDASGAVNKMQDGWLKSGLQKMLAGAGVSGHREDRPLQGTAGKGLSPGGNSSDFQGGPPSNGTRNANAVLSNSISGGYGDKASANKNPNHPGAMISNHHVGDRVITIRTPAIRTRHKKHKRRHHRTTATE